LRWLSVKWVVEILRELFKPVSSQMTQLRF